MSEIQIQQVVFQDDGLVIAYQDMDDIRVLGAVVIQKTVRLDMGHPDYAEDIERIHTKIVKALRSALEDFEDSEVFDPNVEVPDDPNDDDEAGMGE